MAHGKGKSRSMRKRAQQARRVERSALDAAAVAAEVDPNGSVSSIESLSPVVPAILIDEGHSPSSKGSSRSRRSHESVVGGLTVAGASEMASVVGSEGASSELPSLTPSADELAFYRALSQRGVNSTVAKARLTPSSRHSSDGSKSHKEGTAPEKSPGTGSADKQASVAKASVSEHSTGSIRAEQIPAVEVPVIKKSPRPRATVEEVEDEDDPEAVRRRRAESNQPQGSTRTSSTGSHHSASSGTQARPSSEYRSASSKSSHDPSRPWGSPNERGAVERRNGRRLLRYLRKTHPLLVEDGPLTWDNEELVKRARETIARDRALKDDSEEYARRRKEANEAIRRLVSFRIEDDRQYAAEMDAQFAREAADRALAQELSKELNKVAPTHEDASLKVARQFEKEERRAVKQMLVQATAQLEALPKTEDSETRMQRDRLQREVDYARKYRTALRAAKTKSTNTNAVASSSRQVTFEMPEGKVIGQRYRIQDLMKSGSSGIPDQGVDWDGDGTPIEVAPAPSRGSSVGTNGGRQKSPKKERVATADVREPAKVASNQSAPARPKSEERTESYYLKAGNAPAQPGRSNHSGGGGDGNHSGGGGGERGDDGNGRGGGGRSGQNPPSDPSSSSSSSDSDSTESDGSTYCTESNYSRSESTDSAFGYDLESNEAVTVVARPGPRRRTLVRRAIRVSPVRDLREEASRIHLVAIRTSRTAIISDVGVVIHGATTILMDTLGKKSPVASVFEDNKNIKFPTPPVYKGDADIEKFDEHILAMGRWMELLGLGGKRNDHKRVVTHGFYLAGGAKDWLPIVSGQHDSRKILESKAFTMN
ncbi:hypothetical protein C8R46DRAFT_1029871 [Mycena filopes]|nr:hypothetical protein C8R46DRAFT_1029871 [Mycena filopes]